MSTYCVTAIRYNGQKISAVQMGHGDGTPTGWTKEPAEATVAQVVGHIESGENVQTLLAGDGVPSLGPKLKVVAGSDGVKSLALDNDPKDCLELSDLQRF